MPAVPRRRNSVRIKVDWPAVVLFGTNRVPCAVVDVSRGGAKLHSSAHLSPKNYVIIICEKFGSLDGYVVWQRGTLAGIKFTDPGAAKSLRPFLDTGTREDVAATVKFGRRRPN